MCMYAAVSAFMHVCNSFAAACVCARFVAIERACLDKSVCW